MLPAVTTPPNFRIALTQEKFLFLLTEKAWEGVCMRRAPLFHPRFHWGLVVSCFLFSPLPAESEYV